MLIKYFNAYGKAFKTVRRNVLSKKFEPEVFVLDQLVSEGDIVIDAGASYGRYAYAFAKLVGEKGRVYCFEPGHDSHAVLKKVMAFHRFKNVLVVKKALSDREGTSRLTIPLKRGAGDRPGLSLAYLSSGKVAHSKQEVVETCTIDDFCSKRNIGHVDFIKCDVEGGELLILKGAKRVLESSKPIVLCEINDDFLKDKFNATAGDVFNFMGERGYQAFVLKEGKFLKASQEKLSSDNYFFAHPSHKHYEKFRGH